MDETLKPPYSYAALICLAIASTRYDKHIFTVFYFVIYHLNQTDNDLWLPNNNVLQCQEKDDSEPNVRLDPGELCLLSDWRPMLAGIKGTGTKYLFRGNWLFWLFAVWSLVSGVCVGACCWIRENFAFSFTWHPCWQVFRKMKQNILILDLILFWRPILAGENSGTVLNQD